MTDDCRMDWAVHIDRSYGIFRYERPVIQWLASHKYARNMLAGRVLRFFVNSWFDRCQEVVSGMDRLVAVPVHMRRLIFRGFNQATFLLNSQRSIDVDRTLLKKTIYTPHQAGLGGKDRRVNLKGTFAVSKSIENEHILVFDDVRTTGQTLFEISKILKEAGVASVSTLCLSVKESND